MYLSEPVAQFRGSLKALSARERAQTGAAGPGRFLDECKRV